MTDTSRIAHYLNEFIKFFPIDRRFDAHTGLDHALARYNERHRFYHNADHLEDLFVELDKHAPYLTDRELFKATAFIVFHDVVYNTDKAENIALNEVHSAEKAEIFLQRCGADNIVFQDKSLSDSTKISEEVCAAILMTRKHHADKDSMRLNKILLDMDMMILASDRRRYMRYVDQVRQEYTYFGFCNDNIFFEARRDMFLTDLLKKDRIFITDEYENQYGDKARDNIRWEMDYCTRRLNMMAGFLKPQPK